MQPGDSHAINDAAMKVVQRLLDSRYWGSVTLRLEGERGVVHIYREESIKPESLIKEVPTSEKDEPYAHHRNLPK